MLGLPLGPEAPIMGLISVTLVDVNSVSLVLVHVTKS